LPSRNSYQPVKTKIVSKPPSPLRKANPVVWENLYNHRITQEKRHSQLIKEYEVRNQKKQEKEDKECTFTPSITDKSSYSRKQSNKATFDRNTQWQNNVNQSK